MEYRACPPQVIDFGKPGLQRLERWMHAGIVLSEGNGVEEK
jgi:hypothetical protein